MKFIEFALCLAIVFVFLAVPAFWAVAQLEHWHILKRVVLDIGLFAETVYFISCMTAIHEEEE